MAASDILILQERPLHTDNHLQMEHDVEHLNDKMTEQLNDTLSEYSSSFDEREKKKQQMTDFNRLVEDVTERWMGAFKYAAEMNMEDIKTMKGIKRLRHSLNDFLKQNPPVSESELAKITELAHRLGSNKVKEAEHVNSRCAEAKVMLRNRQNQIRGAEKFMKSRTSSKSTDSVGHRSSRSSDSAGKQSSRSTEDKDDNSSYTESLPSSTNESPACLVYSWKEESKHYDEKDSNIAVFDAAMTSETKKRLDNILEEIVGTEDEYVLALEHVLNNYMPYMDSDTLAAVLKGKKNLLFGNIKRIYEFHKRFFSEELESFKRNPLQIGSCFLKWERQFTLYALYKKNKPKSDQLWDDYANIFFEAKKKELSDDLNLAGYLMKPVQRLDRYVVLLKDVLKCCDPDDPRGKEITDALELMKFQIRHGNDLVAMDAITNADINLKEQGCLLRQDEFYVHDGRRERLRRVFLFEQALIFTKAKKTKEKGEGYNYKHSIKTVDVGLTENIGESGLKFEVWYRRWKKGRSNEAFVLQALSLDVKKSWIQDITRILWRQTTRNKEYGLTEASTGISVESTPSSIFIDHASSTYNNGNGSNTYTRTKSMPDVSTPLTQRGQPKTNVHDLEGGIRDKHQPVSYTRSVTEYNLQSPEIDYDVHDRYSFTPTLKRHAIRASYRKKRQITLSEFM